MKRVFPFVLLGALLLTACEPRDSTLSDTSSNISVGSDIIGGSYEERISTMADTGIAIDALDKTEKEVIKLLQNEGGAIFQASLMEKMNIGKVKTTRLLDKLEAKQLIERKRRGMNNMIVLRQ